MQRESVPLFKASAILGNFIRKLAISGDRLTTTNQATITHDPIGRIRVLGLDAPLELMTLGNNAPNAQCQILLGIAYVTQDIHYPASNRARSRDENVRRSISELRHNFISEVFAHLDSRLRTKSLDEEQY